MSRGPRPLTDEAKEHIADAAECQVAVERAEWALDQLRLSRRAAVLEARKAGATWQAIGDAMGMTHQAAQGIANGRSASSSPPA